MSTWYVPARKALLDGQLNLLTGDIRVVLVDSADETLNTADTFLSDITAAGIVAGPVALANRTTTGGVFDADDTGFSAVSGDSVEAAVIYQHTGVSSTARLIAWVDLAASTQPNGGSIVVVWPGAGILTLSAA